MDEREREYLRQQIQELERARRRWKAATIFLLVGSILFVVVATGTLATHGLFTARIQIEEARRQAEEARRQALMAEVEAARKVLEQSSKSPDKGPAKKDSTKSPP
jgi:hypothetical protein